MTADELHDRELLKLAAKAAGLEFGEINGAFKAKIEQEIGTCGTYGCQKHQWRDWNPLTDDGDALRLLIRLGLDVLFTPEDVEVVADQHPTEDSGERVAPWACESWTLKQQDHYAATRRAIVRAAAEIGRSME